jgi:hypothetical protein
MDGQYVCLLTNNCSAAGAKQNGVAVEIGMRKAAAIPNLIATPIPTPIKPFKPL